MKEELREWTPERSFKLFSRVFVDDDENADVLKQILKSQHDYSFSMGETDTSSDDTEQCPECESDIQVRHGGDGNPETLECDCRIYSPYYSAQGQVKYTFTDKVQDDG